MGTSPQAPPWLTARVLPPYRGDASVDGFVDEAERVLEVLTSDRQWSSWWARTSKAPRLELTVLVESPSRSPLSALLPLRHDLDVEVRRGRRRHRLLAEVDPERFHGLEAAEQRELAIPIVLDLLERVVHALRLSDPPAIPAAALPAPLPVGTLRRRRLRELRQEPSPKPLIRPQLTDAQLARERDIVEVPFKTSSCRPTPVEYADVADLPPVSGLWLHRAGSVTRPPVPKGYKGQVGACLQWIETDAGWESWWSASGLDHLTLYDGYGLLTGLSTRLRRHEDHVVGSFIALFGPFDVQRWSVADAQARARQDLESFFGSVGRRLSIGPPPPLGPRPR